MVSGVGLEDNAFRVSGFWLKILVFGVLGALSLGAQGLIIGWVWAMECVG